MSDFKPKSIEELNAAFEEKYALEHEGQESTYIDDDLISEEQRNFYRITPKEETETVAEETAEQDQEKPFEEKSEQETQEAEEIEEISEEVEEEEIPVEEEAQTEEPEEVNEVFEAERLSQQETELFEANNVAAAEAAAKAAEPSNYIEPEENEEVQNSAPLYFTEEAEENAEEETEESGEAEPEEPVQEAGYFFNAGEEEQNNAEKKYPPVFAGEYKTQEETESSQNIPEEPQNKEEVKLTTHKDVKAKKQSKHRTAKTVFNTLISIVILLCLFVNGIIFMADVPRRFLGGYGITVCEHTVANSNLHSGAIVITKKTNVAPDKNIVAALTKDKKVIIDFKQNIPDDAKVYSKAVKLVPKAGGAVKFLRGHWLESACTELAVLLVLLIVRVALGDKKEKAEKPEKKKKNKKNK